MAISVKKSISRQFSLAMISVVAVIVSGFAVALIRNNANLLETELQTRLSLASALAEKSLIDPLWNYNQEYIDGFVDSLFSDHAVVYVSILGDHNIAAKKTHPDFVEVDWTFFEHSAQFLTKSVTIRLEEQELGIIRIAVTKHNIQKIFLVRLIAIIAFTILLVIAISMTSIVITRRTIMHPFSLLVSAAASIADGKLDLPLLADLGQKHRDDEIGVLNRAFQGMVTYLSQMAAVATNISTGDVHQGITPLSEHDVLGNAFQRMEAYLNRLATAATAIAAGDLQQDIQPESEGDVLGNAFHTMAGQLREDFEKIQQEVAERRRAQEALQDLNEKLEQRVEERTAELVQYREHLEDLVKERTIELTRSNALLNEEIIERRRIEQALRVGEEQYRMLAENVKDGIMIVQNGKLVFTNAVITAMTGYPAEWIVMTDPVNLFHDRATQTARARLTSGDHKFSTPRWQAEIITRGGSTLWTEIEQTGIVWNSQPALLLTIRDITDRKLREQRLEEERARLEEENLSLKSSIRDRYQFGPLVGKSQVMQHIYELIVSAATSDLNVLVCGESGTGKELIARTLHQVSWRKAQAFISVNCAAIPETLFEREFFGHRKGAFTGADRDTPGLFDRAHQGTLFLDEVTELSPGTQAKLLRVLQNGEYTPLGSTTPRQADVLIVAATNKYCQQEIEQGRLRKDFFYRIAGIEIRVPPLRERKDDLSLLIEHILEEYQQKQAQIQGSIPQDLPVNQAMLPGEIVQALYTYGWPGNIRELQNILQRYLVTQDVNAILSLLGTSAQPRLMAESSIVPDGLTLPEAVEAFEKRMIVDILAQNDYHITRAAEMLGIPRITMHRKIKKHRLKTKKLKNSEN